MFHGGFWYQKGVLLKHRDETTGQKELSRKTAFVNFTSSLPLASGGVQHMGNIRKARDGRVGGEGNSGVLSPVSFYHGDVS